MDDTLFEENLINSNRILYTPSYFAKTNLIHLQEIGILTSNKPHISKQDNQISYLFFIVQHGYGILKYMGKTYELQTGDCIFIDCKKSYSQHTSKIILWQLCWVHFYGPNMSNIYDKYLEQGGRPVFHPDNIDSFQHIIDNMYKIVNSTDCERDMMINEMLCCLLTNIMRECWHPEPSKRNYPKKQDVFMIKDYLDANYGKKIILDELAEKFFINKFYLTRIFKEQYGCSIINYLQQKRISTAKHMLRSSDKTIEEISAECGIEDPNYFARLFKKVEGIAPGEFRKLL